MAEARLEITGMHCDGCLTLIKDSLMEQEGITDVNIDPETGEAEIGYEDKGARGIGLDKVIQIIKDEGFGIK